jgi:hypothetical protein
MRRFISTLVILLCAAPVALADLKVTTRTNAGGQTMQGTVYIKGSRQRNESGGPAAITQCDLKRMVYVNDRERKYHVAPMDAGGASGDVSASAGPAAASGPSRRGGVVTHSVTLVDTGERQQMFGHAARRVKTSIVMDAPQGTCNPGHTEMEIDGWYIDYPAGFSCPTDARAAAVPPQPSKPGCQDQIRFKTVGTAKTGFPVKTTMRFKLGGAAGEGEDAEASAMMARMMETTTEVVELSSVTLDAALFDVPAGYTQVASLQELYGTPSMGTMGVGTGSGARPPTPPEPDAAGAAGPGAEAAEAGALPPKQPGSIRVGVARINNRAGRELALEQLREGLVSSVEGSGVEAVALAASDAGGAEAEARAKECDFILHTDLTALKQSTAGKVGGMFGRAAGIGSAGADRFESRVDFRLVAVGGGPQLESSATAKEEGAEASVTAALEKEAKAASAAARKKK